MALGSLISGMGTDEFKFSLKPDSIRFAAIGDMGTGDAAQYTVPRKMVEVRKTYPFDLVAMLGDNIYGGSKPEDFEKKIAFPYKPYWMPE